MNKKVKDPHCLGNFILLEEKISAQVKYMREGGDCYGEKQGRKFRVLAARW